MSVAILVFLGAWLVLSILVQVPALRWMIRWFRVRDYFSLLACWSFFAHPGTHCVHIWYQDTLLDGQRTRWNKMELYNPSLWRGVWNPRKAHWKMLEYACASLLEMDECDLQDEHYLTSQPYLLTLASVQEQPRQNDGDFRQFMIAGASPGQQARSVFLSRKHQWGSK